jgi:type II secretory pathway pseudopilin PulG
MTLMEVVVALMIVGLMAGAGVAAFQSIVDHRTTLRGAAVADERAAALRDLVRGWLAAGSIQVQAGGTPNLTGLGGAGRSGAVSIAGSDMNDQTNTAAQAVGDEIVFTTSAPNPAMQADLRIRLYIDGDPSTPEHGLSIEYQTGQATPLQRAMLDSTIDSLDVEFLDRSTGRWFDASQAAAIQPRAARIAMFATHAAGVSPLVSLPIVVPIGNTAVLTGQGLAGQGGSR